MMVALSLGVILREAFIKSNDIVDEKKNQMRVALSLGGTMREAFIRIKKCCSRKISGVIKS